MRPVYSVILILSKPLSARYPPIVLIAWVFVLSAPTIPLFADWGDLFPATVSKKSLSAMVYIILGPTTLAYLLNMFALKRVTASTTAVYIFMQPVIAAVLGALLFAEQVGPLLIVAQAAVLAGILLVSRAKR